MSDPYSILGVSPSATDEEVKATYRELAKKYHPDRYVNSPIADLAGEKMKEINEAYDQIVSERKQRKSGGYSGYSGGSGYGGAAYGGNPGYGGSTEYNDVRRMIAANRLADAEQILDGVPFDRRSAEWYYLKGTVLYRRGWLDEAFNNFTRACQIDPNNVEYRSAYNQAATQRSGMFGGYNPNVQQYGGCGGNDLCTTLCLADLCCNCMGGGC